MSQRFVACYVFLAEPFFVCYVDSWMRLCLVAEGCDDRLVQEPAFMGREACAVFGDAKQAEGV